MRVVREMQPKGERDMTRHHHEGISAVLPTLPFLTAVASLALIEVGCRLGKVIRSSSK
ncbi:MAG: hypothetical protein VB674_09885 [Vicinamibacterales bacterium]